MNILVTGANGQLGNELKIAAKKFAKHTYFFATKAIVDITDINQVQDYIKKNNIDTIINAAAYTNVENAEDDYQLANSINHLAVKNLAKIAKANNLSLVHISTDFVFNGKQRTAYNEKAQTNPINNYGKTKLLGEQAMLAINPEKSIIIRTSWLYSAFNSNFVKTMLRLGEEKEEVSVIDNQFGSPTNARDLAYVLLTIAPKIKNNDVEIYHYSNQGHCSWFNFAQEIMSYSNNNCLVKPINSKNYSTKAQRPNNSLMNTDKIQKEFEIEIPFWKESLKKTIIKI